MKYYKYYNRVARSENASDVYVYENGKWEFNSSISMDMFSEFGKNKYTEITEEEAMKLIEKNGF